MDRSNLGRQTLREFQNFRTPEEKRLFTELYNVQHMQSGFEASLVQKEPVPVGYNPRFPIETFDFIVTDECHRSIYGLWRQVLEYFDSFIIGLTATPSKQTFGFFNQNLVMEYSHDQAVADSVNVGFDLYRIRTYISEHGSLLEAGFYRIERQSDADPFSLYQILAL